MEAAFRPSTAGKKRKCLFFTSRKSGKWTRMVCSIPKDQSCPDPKCKANPGYQEPDPDAAN